MKAIKIPFFSAHSHPPLEAHQLAGPCAMAMAFKALGWELTPEDIWGEVRVEQEAQAYATLSRLTLYARKHGFQAALLRGSVGSASWLLDRGFQVITVFRTHHQLWASGAKLLLTVDSTTVSFHDPIHGPNRKLPLDEFDKLHASFSQHPGHCLITVGTNQKGSDFPVEDFNLFANPLLSCPSCGVIPPEITYTCEECEKPFRYGPGLPLGCPNPQCAHGYWSYVRCANCQQEITLI